MQSIPTPTGLRTLFYYRLSQSNPQGSIVTEEPDTHWLAYIPSLSDMPGTPESLP
jgi:hypothetical protein